MQDVRLTDVPSGDESELPPETFTATVDLLAELTAISSPSGDAAGLGRMAARLAAELASRGLTAEVRRGLEGHENGELDRAGDDPASADPRALPVLLAGMRRNLRPDRPRRHAPGPAGPAGGSASPGGHLLLLGHFDTALQAAPPRRTAERLEATGAVDMKGGLAAFIGALDLLARRGVAPPDDLLLVAVPDEEVGGELSRAAVERWGAQARAVWVLEPGEPGSAPGAETLVGGRRGLFDWRLEVRGTAAHSGLHLADGRSALLAAARWCLEAAGADAWPPGTVRGVGDQGSQGGGPTINVGRLVAGDASFVDDLGSHHGWIGSGRQLNVVPDRAVAEGEARFSGAGDDEAVARQLAGIAERVAAATGATLRFTRTATIPPVDPGGAAQRSACKRAVALAAARGWRLEIEEQRGGVSFPNFLPAPVRVPVLDGLGPIGGGMHTRDEFVDLTSLRRRIVLLADLLEGEAVLNPRIRRRRRPWRTPAAGLSGRAGVRGAPNPKPPEQPARPDQ